jgi:hypothetical protein
MGCRCVIVDKDTNKKNANQKIGIYLHWYGDKETVESLLEDVKAKHPRGVISDPSYGWARLCQIIADKITADTLASEFQTAKEHAYSTGIGIGLVSTLDCHNYDNGVYYIDDDFNIVKQTDGMELE